VFFICDKLAIDNSIYFKRHNMNMKNVLSFVFLCAVGLMTAQGEDIAGKSLEELKAIYVASMNKIKETPECKQVEIIGQQLEKTFLNFTNTDKRCSLYKNRNNGWIDSVRAWAISASEKDCDLAEKYGKECLRLCVVFNDAKEQAVKANSKLGAIIAGQAIIDCMNKKEYEALEITEETV